MRFLRRLTYKLTCGKHYLEYTPRWKKPLAAVDNFLYLFYGPVQNTLWRVVHTIKWIPVLYADRDFDHAYLYYMMSVKLGKMADHFEEHKITVGWEKQVKQCRTASALAKRISDDNYYENMPSHIGEHNKRTYKLEDLRRKQDIDYLCRLLKKHSMSWWD